ADHHLYCGEPANCGVVDARLLPQHLPGTGRECRHRRRVTVSHLLVDCLAAGHARPCRNVFARAGLLVERVFVRVVSDQRERADPAAEHRGTKRHARSDVVVHVRVDPDHDHPRDRHGHRPGTLYCQGPPRGRAQGMIRRPLGSTGLLVTPLCIGCGALASMPEDFGYAVPEAQALATLRLVFQNPINFLDTAAAYGDGESERRIGLVLRELGGLPAGYVVCTKADRNLQTGEFSGEQIARSVDRSLRLLGLDRLALVFLHDPEHTTFERVMAGGGPLEVVQRFKDQGVIEHLGIAGGPVDLLRRYVDTRAFEVVITHNRYTLLHRSAEPLIDHATRMGVAVLNAAPYGSGILAKGPEAYPRYAYREAATSVVERARRMAGLCREAGVPLAAAALQFSVRDPRVGREGRGTRAWRCADAAGAGGPVRDQEHRARDRPGRGGVGPHRRAGQQRGTGSHQAVSRDHGSRLGRDAHPQPADRVLRHPAGGARHDRRRRTRPDRQYRLDRWPFLAGRPG